ncbi:MAG: ABC transporter ATP-binding protein [Bacteroidota bacterium]|nr:ABC transporter ATP-binding protein [Bacteroidota bacterium]
MLLVANNIHKRYKNGEATFLEVLKGVSLSVAEQEIITLVGPSGAGKSTLIHILGLLDKPTEGEVLFDGENISTKNDDAISHLRNKKIGFVFQFHHLLPEFTALENVLMPALIGGDTIMTKIERAKSLLNDVGLMKRENHKPSELSGGEQQRVAVARALMNSPKIIFADEPSGNLDTDNANQLHSLIFELREKYKQTFVIVTHNKELASKSDRAITLLDGKVV